MKRKHPLRSRWGAIHITGAITLLLLTGCFGGNGNFENENDELRRQNLELSEQIEDLQEKVTLRENEIEALEKQLHGDTQRIEGAELPRLTAVKMGRYSGPIDSDGDGRDDRVRVYVQTLDQQGRFTPVTGRAALQVTSLHPEKEPVVLAQQDYDPAALDQAYRSGVSGTHYTLEAALSQPLPADVDRITVLVSITDAATGVSFSDTQAFPLSPRERAGVRAESP